MIPHLQELVQEAVDSLSGVERRKALVSDAWFVRGKMFALVTRQARVVVRLTEPAAQAELLALDGASNWQIKNRKPMRDWLQLPEELHDDAEGIALWVKRAWTDAQAQVKSVKKKAVAKKKRAKRSVRR